mmetsp:Transcript_21116/g.43464  ORF Transcript_21116/g.43464 Transcript_21116/m.43464 type:complete len:241 (-) Transcript_21116:1295-2017(-)
MCLPRRFEWRCLPSRHLHAGKFKCASPAQFLYSHGLRLLDTPYYSHALASSKGIGLSERQPFALNNGGRCGHSACISSFAHWRSFVRRARAPPKGCCMVRCSSKLRSRGTRTISRSTGSSRHGTVSRGNFARNNHRSVHAIQLCRSVGRSCGALRFERPSGDRLFPRIFSLRRRCLHQFGGVCRCLLVGLWTGRTSSKACHRMPRERRRGKEGGLSTGWIAPFHQRAGLETRHPAICGRH